MVSRYFYPSLMYTLGAGRLFDFSVTSTRGNVGHGESLFRALGYDGLAVISSPEMYNYALQLTAPIR